MIIVDKELEDEINRFLNNFERNGAEYQKNYIKQIDMTGYYIEFINYLVSRGLKIK